MSDFNETRLEEVSINQDVNDEHVRLVGPEITCTVAMEECGELIQAISKGVRDKYDSDHSAGPSYWPTADHRMDMEEEVADVLICIDYIMGIFDLDSDNIQKWVDKKQKRQVIRDNAMKERAQYVKSGNAEES